MPRPDLPRRAAVVALLAITLVGGALRFWRLDAPAIWGDEALTYRRVTGSYDELLRNLRNDGFVPLHYQLYWWVSRGMPVWPRAVAPEGVEVSGGTPVRYRAALRLADVFGVRTANAAPGGDDGSDGYDASAPPDVVMTPAAMRVAPAVAGTLMVPAVYFLAGQVTRRRRVALLAAGLACVSAYLLAYSRDAKMYMPMWLFATLHVGCLLAWLHALGDPSRTASARRLWWWAWVATGVACVGVHAPGLMALAVDALIFATAGGRLDPTLAAVERRGRYLPEAMLRAIDAAALPARAAVAAVERLTPDRPAVGRLYAIAGERSRLGRTLQRRGDRFRWPALLPFALGLLVVAAGPWGYYRHFNQYGEKLYGEDGRPADEVRWGASGLGWVEWYNAGRDGGDLLLYATSAYLTGWEWPQPRVAAEVPEFRLAALRTATLGLLALLAAGLLPWRRAGRWLARGRSADPTEIAPAPVAWRPIFWIAAWVALPAYGVYCASSNTFVAPIYWPAALVFADVPDLQRGPPLVVDAPAEGPTDAPPGKRLGPLDADWRASAIGVWGDNLDALRAAATPGNVRWGVLAGLLAAVALGVVLCAPTWPARLRTAGAMAGVAVAVWGLCFCVYAAMVAKGRVTGGSVWMPRYMGVAWPAVIVAVAVLFSRLPTRPLRAVAVGLFVAANLGQFALRVAGHSEPPTDRIAADLIAAGPPRRRPPPGQPPQPPAPRRRPAADAADVPPLRRPDPRQPRHRPVGHAADELLPPDPDRDRRRPERPVPQPPRPRPLRPARRAVEPRRVRPHRRRPRPPPRRPRPRRRLVDHRPRRRPAPRRPPPRRPRRRLDPPRRPGRGPPRARALDVAVALRPAPRRVRAVGRAGDPARRRRGRGRRRRVSDASDQVRNGSDGRTIPRFSCSSIGTSTSRPRRVKYHSGRSGHVHGR